MRTIAVAFAVSVLALGGVAHAQTGAYSTTDVPKVGGSDVGTIVDDTAAPQVLGVTEVRGATDSVSPSSDTPSVLAFTGGDILGFVVMGAGALAIGLAAHRPGRHRPATLSDGRGSRAG